MQIINPTPYLMDRVVVFDRHGNETLLVIIKGTFDFSSGQVEMATEQVPIFVADEYYGDPVESSIHSSTDMLPLRPSTGVTLKGCALANGVPVRTMPVGLKVGSLQQKAMVYGERIGWDKINQPQPFDVMPLTWENAFGGYDQSEDKPKHHDALPANPVGKGFRARRSKLDQSLMPLPNVENVEQPVASPHDRVHPIGFGAIPPFWESRRQFAGTYDEQWEKERAPLLPDDFDERFLQAAPPELTSQGYLNGDEQVVIIGMTPGGRADFQMHSPAPIIGVRLAGSGVRSKPKLESIHFDTDQQHYSVVWKSEINIQGKLESVKNIEARIL